MSTSNETILRAEAASRPRVRTGFFTRLEGQPALGRIGPNWFASVMGTGIVANAAATLPVSTPLLTGFAVLVWLLAAALLVAVGVVFGLHWMRHGQQARAWFGDPVMGHFYGAPAMALMTVGAGALLVGHHLIGEAAAVGMSSVLWVAGTALGLFTAAALPYQVFVHRTHGAEDAFGGWLMPVVPPMVSAATGALLLPHLPEGQWRSTMFALCWAMFGLTLLASIFVTSLIWSRMTHHDTPPATTVPTLWIVLGWLGQSVTAAHLLGEEGPDVLAAPYGEVFRGFGMVYGLPVWGFAMLWLVIAGAITVRTARHGMPFALTWWSFTFPLGTVVTGTAGIADATGLHLFEAVAVALYVGLVAAWLLVLTRTARGIWCTDLLR